MNLERYDRLLALVFVTDRLLARGAAGASSLPLRLAAAIAAPHSRNRG